MAYVKDPGQEYIRKTNRFVVAVLAAAGALLAFILVYSYRNETEPGMPGDIRTRPVVTSPGTR